MVSGIIGITNFLSFQFIVIQKREISINAYANLSSFWENIHLQALVPTTGNHTTDECKISILPNVPMPKKNQVELKQIWMAEIRFSILNHPI